MQPKLLDHKTIEVLFSRFEKRIPNPKTELEYTSPFTLLIAVLLSAQSTDKSVNKVTPHLFAHADTPQKMLAMGLEALKDHIKTIGLYKTKAAHIIKLGTILIEKHKGAVPQTREELEALPGVGRKTANVVLNVVFGMPTLAVDTHIFRVSQRLGLAFGKTPLAIEKQLLDCIPQNYSLHAHHWLILHGRYICKARNPLCDQCIQKDLCPSYYTQFG